MSAEIHDERFARLYTDPRFQRMPKKERKVMADDRFAAMAYADLTVNAKVVDKHGGLPQKNAKKTLRVRPSSDAAGGVSIPSMSAGGLQRRRSGL